LQGRRWPDGNFAARLDNHGLVSLLLCHHVNEAATERAGQPVTTGLAAEWHPDNSPHFSERVIV
jgi:hypothetical protein